jgi:hypothetical protein
VPAVKKAQQRVKGHILKSLSDVMILRKLKFFSDSLEAFSWKPALYKGFLSFCEPFCLWRDLAIVSSDGDNLKGSHNLEEGI